MTDLRLMSVEAARAAMLATAAPLPVERIATGPDALGRVLAEPLAAQRDQPPFDAAAMDGYAVTASGLADDRPVRLRVIGESAAGRGLARPLGEGEAARIFTGAPTPAGTAFVVPQESAERDGDAVVIAPRDQSGPYFRTRGVDFRAGDALLPAGVRLDPWRVGLAAAAGLGELSVHRRPRVAILSTGEELVAAGGSPGPDQIFNSGTPAVASLVRQWGGEPVMLTSAGDNAEAIVAAVREVAADLLVTIGGASVGDHDLVKPALETLGLTLAVASVAVRPGKPTWFGQLADGRRVLGLPGNPASALVCSELFLRPLVDALSGHASALRLRPARLATSLASNGPREHWMRARLSIDTDGACVATPMPDQDSSLVSVFAVADALLRRAPHATAAGAGELVDVLPLDRLD
jgi:molybdopterin molybdotransferase